MTDLWHAALSDLRAKVSTHNYDSWFKNITCHHVEESTAYLEVADDFNKAWIEDNYLDLIEDALEHATGECLEVVLEVRGSFDTEKDSTEIDIDIGEDRMAARESRVAQNLAESRVELKKPDVRQKIIDAGMNPRYTFDEFVVGASNQFVHAAAAAVATTPARTYNPLFIFGGVGLGKTHLLQAVGIETLKHDPTKRVMYLSSEAFMNQLITSLRQKDMNSFRMQFRNDCDVLLIDDIQFIGGKDSTQEEFFHTFNALYQSGKQIVMTSDKPPNELPGIEDRLASRFSWGLLADIQPPAVETRIAILEKKAEADGIQLHNEVALLIANCVRSNVRELEGTLIRLGAQASLLGQKLTVDFARDMLKRMNLTESRQITAERIIKLVSSHYGIKPGDIKGARRTRNISIPRQIAMYLARRHTDDSYPELGRKFGGKDHTTVMAACRKMKGIVEEETDELAEVISDFESMIRNM